MPPKAVWGLRSMSGDAAIIAPSNENAVTVEPVSDDLDSEFDVLVQPAAE